MTAPATHAPDGGSGAPPARGAASFWIPVGEEWAAAWLHSPPEPRVRTSTVLLCSPFGHEYVHAHRSLIHLADALAGAGFPTLRLDYPGTGDSTGSGANPGFVDACVEALREGARTLEALVPSTPVTVVGLRMGATLAARLSETHEVRHFVAWIPVDGRRYVRELDALRKVSGAPLPPDGSLDAGGFQMSAEAVADVRALELGSLRISARGEALVVERGDLGPDDRFAGRLGECGLRCDSITQPDYPSMVAEPQFTVVPREAIGRMVGWLAEREDFGDEGLRADALERMGARRAITYAGVSERIVTVPATGTSGLFGIHCAPASEPPDPPLPADTPIVVLPNAGSVHHVGPNRLYVELARYLARRGVASLRFDLRNLGDSRVGSSPDENHPYPRTAVDDVAAAISWALSEAGHDSAVVAGLCSGAYTAFRSGIELQSLPIRGVVSINPLTFEWHDGLTLATPDTEKRHAITAQYYSRAVRNPRSWMRLLRGQSAVGHILRFVSARTLRLARRGVTNAMGLLRLRKLGRLERDLIAFEHAGRRLHFVFAEPDPGHVMLFDQARTVTTRLMHRRTVRLTMIRDADHTFSRRAWKDAAIEAVGRDVDRLAREESPA